MKNTRMQKESEDRESQNHDFQENKPLVAALGTQMKTGFLHLLSRCLLLKAFQGHCKSEGKQRREKIERSQMLRHLKSNEKGVKPKNLCPCDNSYGFC